jgi:hypothetical protein
MGRLPLIWPVMMVMTVIACSPKPYAVHQIAGLVDDGMIAFERDDDLELLEKAFPANIKLLEAVLANDPDNRQMLTLLSRLYGSYAFGFVETRLEAARYHYPLLDSNQQDVDQLNKKINRYYEKGILTALKALENHVPGTTAALSRVDTVSSYLDRLGPEAAASLYWYGFNLGAWINNNRDSVRAVSRAHLARQAMQRVLELDPTYHHGGARLFLMIYYGSRPAMMGGSLQQANDHYLALKQMVGDDFLLTDLFYARFCLTQQQDRDGFVDLMQRIVDHPTTDSDVALYNAIAVQRAAIYLSALDLWFE